MKVGDKVWLFDENRRVYKKEYGSSPIYSEYFYQVIIEGETRNSWIIEGNKFSKKTLQGIYTNETKTEKIWEHENRYKIREKINYCSIKTLKQISNLLLKNNE